MSATASRLRRLGMAGIAAVPLALVAAAPAKASCTLQLTDLPQSLRTLITNDRNAHLGWSARVDCRLEKITENWSFLEYVPRLNTHGYGCGSVTWEYASYDGGTVWQNVQRPFCRGATIG